MASRPGPAQFGATFVPGGMDDYYMPPSEPELVSPAPQRIMPEVPGNIQNGISNMSLESDSQHSRVSSFGSNPQGPGNHDYRQTARPTDGPNFSPFPKLNNAPPNIPPSDEDKEATLENARVAVLNSNDPEMQLSWAQDALQYVEICQLDEERMSQTKPPRPVTPQAEHQLRVDAMNVVNFLADQHHPKAEFLRGMWLEFGKFGLRMDKREAFRCYSRAADKGYARAEYRIGMQYEQSNDPAKALVHYNRGVDMGDSASNYRLGMMTLLGQHGQPRDFQRGIQLVRQAAETADENAPQGSYVFGMLLARELPQVSVPEQYLPYDENSARIYIEKAAFLGFAKAQVKMGAAYELCNLGCEFNPAISLHYNALAARQGELEGDMALSKWFLCGYEGVFEKNEELAYVYALRAAQGGLPTAQFAMGYFNEIGVHVPVNLNKAMEWYQKALEGGNQDAAGRIEGIRHNQTLSKKDHEQTAITRIKSQYGSKRGGRPARFQQKAQVPQLEPISSEEANHYSGPPLPPSPHPPRSSSRTPGAPAPYPDERPPTVAPYPNDAPNGPPKPYRQGAPPAGPPPQGGFLNTGPDYRSGSAVSLPSNPGAFRGRPGSAATMPPDRPSTGVDAMGPPGPRMPPQQRVSSTGTIPQQQQGGFRPPQQRQQSPANRPDLGYIAPASADVRANRTPRPQGSFDDNTGLGLRRPSPGPPGGFGGPQLGRQSPAGFAQHRVASGGPGRGMGMGGPMNSNAPGPGQLPQSQSMPNMGAGPAPARAKPVTSPGKGPKTFEEMGVPAHKDNSECVVM